MTIRRERPQPTRTEVAQGRVSYEAKDENDFRDAFASLFDEWLSGVINRRTFLTHVAALMTATALPSMIWADTGKITTAKTTSPVHHVQEPWRTLVAVQDHLFPTTDDAPGAREIHATAYLEKALAEPDMDPDDREFIKNGVTWLDEISRGKQGAAFIGLNERQREEVLRQIEKTGAGRRWLSLLLVYTFEALLSDPVYGGNPGGIGWQWLGHQPGFPRPPARQRYQELKKL